MSKHKLTRNILLYELIGFFIVIIILWLDEIFDIPHNIFGFEATPINWCESIFETIFVFILSFIIVFVTWRLLKRIKYLEGFLIVCSYCKKIRVDEDWIPIELYIQEHYDAAFFQSLCSVCFEVLYGDFLKKKK